MIPDFIPDTYGSPYGADGYRDFVPTSREELDELNKKKDTPIDKLTKSDLTDEDLRDMGINPTKYKKLNAELDDKAISALDKLVDLE